MTCIGNAANAAYGGFRNAVRFRLKQMVNVSSLNPAHNFFTKHHNLEEAGPESWRVRCMSTQLIDEGDLINEMNNEQKITATARQENG